MKKILYSILFLFLAGSLYAQNPVVTVKHGGTGASTAAGARTNLGITTGSLAPDTAVTNSASGAITIPSAYFKTWVSTYNGGAGSYTLAAPAVSDNWKRLTLVVVAAQTDTVTCSTDGFNAKGSSGTIIFGGHIGDNAELLAYNGHWFVLPSTNLTVN